MGTGGSEALATTLVQVGGQTEMAAYAEQVKIWGQVGAPMVWGDHAELAATWAAAGAQMAMEGFVELVKT